VIDLTEQLGLARSTVWKHLAACARVIALAAAGSLISMQRDVT